MSLASIIILLGMAMIWMLLVVFYGSRQGEGCWCGPFFNWVPADGMLHAVDSLHFEHVLPFVCSIEHQCISMEGKPAREGVGQHWMLFLVWCIGMGTLPLMIVGGIALKKLFVLLLKK